MNEFDDSCVKNDNEDQAPYQTINVCNNLDDGVPNIAHTELVFTFVEAIGSMSTERSALNMMVFNKAKHVTTTAIDSCISLINISEKCAKKINGKTYTDEDTTTIARISASLSLASETCPQWLDKYNPHVDWGPMF